MFEAHHSCALMLVQQQHNDTDATVSLVRRLQQLGRLSAAERRLIESTSLVVRNFEADQDIAPEGKPLLACPLLLDGFACRYRMLESGQRQITAFLVPDDICDLTSLLLRKLDHSIGALTAARVAFIPHAIVHSWAKHHPGLGQLLWRATLIDAAVSREWIVNVGRRTAYQRTAHLLCELMLRMRAAGRAHGLSCAMPLTQTELGDALGLTPVHVNRTLQWLRGESLIELGAGVLTLRNWRELKRAAGFDPAYLHQATFAGRSSLLKAPLVPRAGRDGSSLNQPSRDQLQDSDERSSGQEMG